MEYNVPFGFGDMLAARLCAGKTYFFRPMLLSREEIDNLIDSYQDLKETKYLHTSQVMMKKYMRSDVPKIIYDRIVAVTARIDKFVIEYIRGYTPPNSKISIANYISVINTQNKFQVRLHNDIISGTGSRVSAIIATQDSWVYVYSDMSWNHYNKVPMRAGDILLFDNDLWLMSKPCIAIYFEYFSGNSSASAIRINAGP